MSGSPGSGFATAIPSPAWCGRISSRREQALTLRYHPGARLVFADGTPDILAYPRDRPAWGRLCRLLTRGNLRAEKGDCILTLDDLLDHHQGLELIAMPTSTRDKAEAAKKPDTSQDPSAVTPGRRAAASPESMTTDRGYAIPGPALRAVPG